MLVETPAGAFQKFRGGLQIHLCASDGAMSHVGGQQREFCTQVYPLPIPRQKAVHGKRVTQVMDPRSSLTLRPPDAGVSQYRQEDGREFRMFVSAPTLCEEYKRVRRYGEPGFLALA